MANNEEAEHEFGALNTLLLVVILGLVVIAAYFIKQHSFYFMPESGAAIFVGMLAGALTTFVYPAADEIQFLTLQPEIFFFLLLPPIIFEAGYSLNKTSFFTNFWSISLYAVLGTIISSLVTGYFVFLMGRNGLVDINTKSPMEALVFGSLLSAIDPVATLSILGNPSLRVKPLLYSLVFGESVLNDAVSIVLFKTFLSFSQHSRIEAYPGENILLVMGQFTLICLGSILVGVCIGLVCSFLCKHAALRKYPEYEIAILFICAYGSYSFAEAVEASGIMSLFFCGIVLSHYNFSNLSSTSRITSHYIFKSLAAMSEFMVYLYIGLGLFTGKAKGFNSLFFICTMLVCICARFCNIFPLSLILNQGRSETISLKMQTMQWFAGLRGAISFVLAMQIPAKQHGRTYLSTTLGVVIFTTVVFGGLTVPALRALSLQDDSEPVDLVHAPDHQMPPTSPSSYEEINMEDTSSDSGMNPLSTSPIGRPTRGYEKLSSTARSPPGGAKFNGPVLSDFIRRFDEEYMMHIFSTGSQTEHASNESDHSGQSSEIELGPVDGSTPIESNGIIA